MPDPASLAFGVLGAFNNSIQCFDYVHVARNFDRDARSAVLKLDIAKLKLSRWSKSVGMDRVQDGEIGFSNISASPDELRKARQLLQQIEVLFDDAQKASKNWKLEPADVRSTILDPASQSLHDRLKTLCLKYFRPRNVVQKVKWGVHSEKHTRKLVEDITQLVDKLIELFPASRKVLDQLYGDEGRRLALDNNVGLLRSVLEELDPVLKDKIRRVDVDAFQMVISFDNFQQLIDSGNLNNNFGHKPLGFS